MRRHALVAAVATATGCADQPARPALQLDILVRPNGVWLNAIEVDRPDACNQTPFADLGVCDTTSDGWSCSEPTPAGWMRELRAEVGEVVVGTGYYDAPFDGYVSVGDATTAGAVLVIVTDDGDEVAIPLPATAPPLPTIDEVVERGDEIDVSWTSAPAAASAVVSLDGGGGGPRCHVAGPGPATLTTRGQSSGAVLLATFAAPTIEVTALGEARIWVGGVTARERLP